MDKKSLGKGSGNRPRRPNSRYITTHTGRVLKVNRSLKERWIAKKEARARRKVDRMRGLPKSRLKRIIWRMHPKRLAAYWFSRDGAIMALKVTGITIFGLFILMLGVFAYFRKELPAIDNLSASKLGGSISYYDRTGQVLLWQDYNAVKRIPKESKDISQYIKDATVAVEDRDFYKHRGFDISGITRAALNDIMHRSTRQGGSTITQQLVKVSLDWTYERSFTRKAKELILAVELERTYTKDEILTGYLNAAPYGSVNHGVEAAASDYFHKPAKELTLDEAAMLAVIPKSPALYSIYSPDFNQQAFIGRYHYVLDSMVQTKKIGKAEAEAAKKVDVLVKVHPQQTKYAGIQHPYFVLAAKDELTKKFLAQTGKGSGKVGGWKVTTTMDVKLQELAEQQVNKGLVQVKRQGGDVATLVAEDVKTGQMVALVGGTDFNHPDYGKINYAQWPVSPGSSFKPYDYVSLIENSNAGAGSVIYDIQQPLPGYPCTNKAHPRSGGNCLQDYDFRYPGPLTIRYSLGGSRNVPAVKAMLIAGVDKTRNMAKSMMGPDGYGYNCFGDQALTQAAPCYGSSGIGDGAYLHLDEHTHGFATMSRNGLYVPQTYILKIQQATSKKPFYEWKQDKKQEKQVVKPDSAYIVGNILSDPNASYFPSSQKIHRYKGWNFALKTGTTNDAKDGLLMGFSTKYAVGVWVGYHTRQKAMSGFMETMTRPIWNGFMTGAHGGLQPENWKQPSGVKSAPAYVVRTHVGNGSVEPSPSTELFPSWYQPKSKSNENSTIDKVSNKLATDCTPPLARENVQGSGDANHFSVDTFHGAGGNQDDSSSTDDVHSCSDAKPAVASFFINGQNMSGGGSVTCEGTCHITAAITQGTHPLGDPQRPQFPGTVNLLVNGQTVQSQNVSESTTVNFDYPGSGSVTMAIQVVDSVLYDATSASATVNFTQSNALSFNSAKVEGSKTKFNWSGGSGPYTVFNRDNPLIVYCTTSDTKCEYPSPLPVGTPVRVRDSTGAIADTTVST